jgi:hypothetical protein
MISETELRIGSIVNMIADYGYGLKVSVIPERQINAGDILGASTNVYKFEAIPLSEEWLLKFGAERLSAGGDSGGWRIPNVKNYNTFVIWNLDEEGGFKPVLDRYSDAPLQYVHQLQNLYFALTGEELIVKELV